MTCFELSHYLLRHGVTSRHPGGLPHASLSAGPRLHRCRAILNRAFLISGLHLLVQRYGNRRDKGIAVTFDGSSGAFAPIYAAFAKLRLSEPMSTLADRPWFSPFPYLVPELLFPEAASREGNFSTLETSGGFKATQQSKYNGRSERDTQQSPVLIPPLLPLSQS